MFRRQNSSSILSTVVSPILKMKTTASSKTVVSFQKTLIITLTALTITHNTLQHIFVSENKVRDFGIQNIPFQNVSKYINFICNFLDMFSVKAIESLIDHEMYLD
jgi:hypothetical protein